MVYGKVDEPVGFAAETVWSQRRFLCTFNCLANSFETNSIVNFAVNYTERELGKHPSNGGIITFLAWMSAER